jgi:hypothetical protein
MGLDKFVIDTLPVNQPYDGLVAEAYDVSLPHDADDPDVDTYRRLIERRPGPALELGCGTILRRHLLRWWTREQLEELPRACGYLDVRSNGTPGSFIAEAHSA